VHFIPFVCIRDRLVALRISVQNGPNWCKSLCQEVASKFFATNAPDPPHWTLNSCFGAFRTILVHLGPFGWLTKLGAKRAELVQKFVARSRIEIFRNERTRYILLDPKLMFWCISYNFGALQPFGWLTKLGAKWAELVQKFVPRKAVEIFLTERTHSTPLDPKLMFCCISYNFGAFGTVWSTYETRCKTGGNGTKVRGTKSHRKFSKWTHPIHPIGA